MDEDIMERIEDDTNIVEEEKIGENQKQDF
jgi:hypothetical protein